MGEVDYKWLPEDPYPGLLSYDERYQRLFVGRLEDAKECAQKLQSAKILVLHGLSGCGKSSFLRAAFKPHIDSIYKSQFKLTELKDETGTLFVRSGADPLRSLSQRLFDLVKAYNDGKRPLPKMQDPHPLIKDYASEDEFVSKVSESCYEMLTILSGLRRITDVTPIIIIDQAEEVFTLHESEHEHAYAEFFKLLVELSKSLINVRVCVTMRTEYKGRFDDELEEYALKLRHVCGHYLTNLDEEDIIKAILAPTSTQPVDCGPAPFTQYRFQFDCRVAEIIATALCTKLEPPGGRLPVLQVICKRLYEHAIRERANTIVPITITETDFLKLGTVRKQIERYLDEKLHALVSLIYKENEQSLSKDDTRNQIDAWRLLLRKMVIEQPDGRATATGVNLNDLERAIERLGLCGVQSPPELIKRLSWLAQEGISLLRRPVPDRDGRVTLGHDSLGLVLLQKQRDSKRLVYDLAEFEADLGIATTLTEVYIISDAPIVPDEESPLWDSMISNMKRKTHYSILLPSEKGAADLAHLRARFRKLGESAMQQCLSHGSPDDFINVSYVSHSADKALRDHSWDGTPHIAYVITKDDKPRIAHVLCGTGEHPSIPEPYLILPDRFSEWFNRAFISSDQGASGVAICDLTNS